LPWFFDSLNLTSSQRDSIAEILRANRPRTEAVFARAREAALPEVRAIAASTRASIDSLLTTEQREKLAKMPQGDRRRGSPGRDSGRRD
jgi:Spy/CpxP family protein refolding chaperone